MKGRGRQPVGRVLRGSAGDPRLRGSPRPVEPPAGGGRHPRPGRQVRLLQVGKSPLSHRYIARRSCEQKRDGFNFISNDLFCTSTSNIRNIRKGWEGNTQVVFHAPTKMELDRHVALPAESWDAGQRCSLADWTGMCIAVAHHSSLAPHISLCSQIWCQLEVNHPRSSTSKQCHVCFHHLFVFFNIQWSSKIYPSCLKYSSTLKTKFRHISCYWRWITQSFN